MEIDTGLEVLPEGWGQGEEDEARRAAAAAVSSGLLRPEEAEALRLRLLLEASGRRLWALRQRLAAYEAEREAHNAAEVGGCAVACCWVCKWQLAEGSHGDRSTGPNVWHLPQPCNIRFLLARMTP